MTKISGFRWVGATLEELAEYRRNHPHSKRRPKRLQCERCGARIWGSGLGIGSHRRHCKGSPQ